MTTDGLSNTPYAVNILEALRFLAARCDGASAKDGQGFNKPDAWLGKKLAEREYLTEDDTIQAMTLLAKYGAQLKEGGITLPERHKAVNEAKEADLGRGEILLDGQVLKIVFPYNPKFVSLVKTLKGARFVANGEKYWTVPLGVGEDALKAFPKFKVSPDARDAIATWEAPKFKGQIVLDKKHLIIRFEYDAALVERVKTIQGAKFDRENTQWTAPLSNIQMALDTLKDFQVDPAVRTRLEQDLLQARAQDERDSRLTAKLLAYADGPLPSGRTLFKHQEEAKVWLREHRRAILADDMGLGKSLTSLMAARAFELPIYVICPASLKINWGREAAMVGVEVTTYSWAKIPAPPNKDFVLIADECFPFDTPITTDHGPLTIGEIVENQLPVSVLSCNTEHNELEWKPIARYIKRPRNGELTRIIHEQGSFICTPNHKIWTEEYGYVEAATIISGTNLRILQNPLQDSDKGETNGSILLSPMCSLFQSASDHSKNQGGGTEKTYRMRVRILPQTIRAYPLGASETSILQQDVRESGEYSPEGILHGERDEGWEIEYCAKAPRCVPKNEGAQSHQKSFDRRQNEGKNGGENIPITWGKRNADSTSIGPRSSNKLPNGIPDSNVIGQGKVPVASDLLQGRFGSCREQDSNRDRWTNSQHQEVEVSRSSQDGSLKRSRVVRVEIYQPASYGESGSGTSRNPSVYNLEIADNHNYFAAGILVSNCHYAQSLKSNRTQAFLDWCDSSHCAAAFFLTGTPLKNGRPVNLYPLLKAARHPLANDKSAYEKRYCDAHPTRFTAWDTSGASHLDELHAKTRDVILRRMKKDCLDLPGKTRVIRPAEASAKAAKLYKERFEKLRQEFHERIEKRKADIREKMVAEGKTDEDIHWETKMVDIRISMAEAITLLNHVRHAAEWAKTETAIELAGEVIEQGGQAVIFVAFTEPGAAIAEALGVPFFSGDLDGKRRQAIIDDFQAGKTNSFVGTLQAGGVGITLTAAQTVILVSRGWTPADGEQAEDRLNRIGQQNAVTSIWLQWGAVDESIDELLQAKQERIELVLHGKRKTLRGTGNIGELAQELLPLIMEE